LMLIKYALVDFSPVEVAFFQAAIGAVGLLAIVLFQGGRARAMMVDILRRPLQAILLGALAIAAPFILISTGELSIPSGLAGVLLSSLPMFVAFFAPFLDRSAKINRIQALGLMVGLVGVALVVGVQAVGSLGQRCHLQLRRQTALQGQERAADNDDLLAHRRGGARGSLCRHHRVG
jgi:drug/metabolite transporter (DMT)-like permease